jgi:Phosphotransferase enzyme family
MLVELGDGRSVFVKQAVDAPSAHWLRREFLAYSHLRGSFLPKLLGWHDDGEYPTLVLEDLSGCQWAPPWTPALVKAVCDTLARVAAHPPFPGLATVSSTAYAEDGWAEVAANPEPFLSLGLCRESWLKTALPVLLDAARIDALDGPALVHLDVRSDNLCFRDGEAVLFDWNLAAVGNPEFDVAFWLPSLELEGGPAPEGVCAVDPSLVASVAGFFAARAGLPLIPEAPGVRGIQRRQLEVALPWAARSLELPPPFAS